MAAVRSRDAADAPQPVVPKPSVYEFEADNPFMDEALSSVQYMEQAKQANEDGWRVSCGMGGLC